MLSIEMYFYYGIGAIKYISHLRKVSVWVTFIVLMFPRVLSLCACPYFQSW